MLGRRRGDHRPGANRNSTAAALLSILDFPFLDFPFFDLAFLSLAVSLRGDEVAAGILPAFDAFGVPIDVAIAERDCPFGAIPTAPAMLMAIDDDGFVEIAMGELGKTRFKDMRVIGIKPALA